MRIVATGPGRGRHRGQPDRRLRRERDLLHDWGARARGLIDVRRRAFACRSGELHRVSLAARLPAEEGSLRLRARGDAVLRPLRTSSFHMDVTTACPCNAGSGGLDGDPASLGRWRPPATAGERISRGTTWPRRSAIIELNYLKIHCGYQDHYMTVFGGLNFMDFRDKEHYRRLDEELYATVEPLAGPTRRAAVSSWRTPATSTSPAPCSARPREVARRRERGWSTATGASPPLPRAASARCVERDWETLARLMNENHRIQQRLGASRRGNDRLIDGRAENGALAAKLAGAGGGGTIIALTHDPESLKPPLEAAGAERFLTRPPLARRHRRDAGALGRRAALRRRICGGARAWTLQRTCRPRRLPSRRPVRRAGRGKASSRDARSTRDRRRSAPRTSPSSPRASSRRGLSGLAAQAGATVHARFHLAMRRGS